VLLKTEFVKIQKESIIHMTQNTSRKRHLIDALMFFEADVVLKGQRTAKTHAFRATCPIFIEEIPVEDAKLVMEIYDRGVMRPWRWDGKSLFTKASFRDDDLDFNKWKTAIETFGLRDRMPLAGFSPHGISNFPTVTTIPIRQAPKDLYDVETTQRIAFQRAAQAVKVIDGLLWQRQPEPFLIINGNRNSLRVVDQFKFSLPAEHLRINDRKGFIETASLLPTANYDEPNSEQTFDELVRIHDSSFVRRPVENVDLLIAITRAIAWTADEIAVTERSTVEAWLDLRDEMTLFCGLKVYNDEDCLEFIKACTLVDKLTQIQDPLVFATARFNDTIEDRMGQGFYKRNLCLPLERYRRRLINAENDIDFPAMRLS
jgi:hypothetical protein